MFFNSYTSTSRGQVYLLNQRFCRKSSCACLLLVGFPSVLFARLFQRIYLFVSLFLSCHLLIKYILFFSVQLLDTRRSGSTLRIWLCPFVHPSVYLFIRNPTHPQSRTPLIWIFWFSMFAPDIMELLQKTLRLTVYLVFWRLLV